MIRRPPRSTQSRSSAASDVYKRQAVEHLRRIEMVNGKIYTNIKANLSKLLFDAEPRALLGNASKMKLLDDMMRLLEGTTERAQEHAEDACCLLYTSPSPRDRTRSRMPSSA
eukprot:TRINITY_DN2377_c0_g1_i1.p1 TRINITY_DN2377_c0_g1~~TRINITY_DN2377_c0_g1_i1.p1  ORF type:complete len:112 (-),score=69.93 TRINITY_DN2377_c0_g1_i1:106-441(-)